MRIAVCALVAAFLLPAAARSEVDDPDADRDGLSDFQETHKYATNPKSADSDSDGVPDGDWLERREFTYTVRTIVQVLRPVTPEFLNDDYQDSRVLDETPEYVELEVIHYPLNSVGDALVGNTQWRKEAERLAPYLEPGPTANWDVAMQRELVEALLTDGIDPAKLDDKTLVERASAWLLKRAVPHNGFTTFSAVFENGKPAVRPETAEDAEAEARKLGRTLAEEWDHELLARGMFRNRSRGSCSSSAIYLTGCLRALGIPTRTVLCIPAVDANDEREVELVRERLTHARVRGIVLAAVQSMRGSWSSHTFNEVFVGGRWRRLNYDRLGQNILDPQCLGLMTHVATFRDWADARMADTIGKRQGAHVTDDIFGGPNPYSAVTLSDRFGPHASIAADPVEPPFRTLTIEKAYWYQSQDPASAVQMRLDDPDTAGHVLLHVREGRPHEGTAQYAEFWGAVDKAFTLRAPNEPDLRAEATRGYWAAPERGVQEFYLRIDPVDFARMPKGAAYALVPRNASKDYRWAVADGVSLTRTAGTPAETVKARTMTIESVAWSDSKTLSAELREALASSGGLTLLARPKEWDGWDSFKEFTERADSRFYLEADGHPPLSIAAGTGGITSSDGSTRWIVLPLGPADIRDIARGTRYRLVPRNSSASHRWIVDPALAVVRE